MISEDSTTFRITGTVRESLHGVLRPEDEVTIRVSNPLRNKDLNPIAVKPGRTYIAFLNPSYFVDSSEISHYAIQDPPFGISPLTMTLLANTKRRIETKTNKANRSSPARAESK
ncbi:MAG: hypothetical protein AAF357_02985 [Verrucomicrobiota bacterium]